MEITLGILGAEKDPEADWITRHGWSPGFGLKAVANTVEAGFAKDDQFVSAIDHFCEIIRAGTQSTLIAGLREKMSVEIGNLQEQPFQFLIHRID